MPHDTIPMRLCERAQRTPDAPAFYTKQAGEWRSTSWAQYEGEVLRAAKALLALGVEPGASVALITGNRPEWSVLMLAVMSVGARGAGIYATSSAREIAYILDHAGARIVLIDDGAVLERVRQGRTCVPTLERVITTQQLRSPEDPSVIAWGEFMELGRALPDATVRERSLALTPDSVATLVYTSGAEALPQGVMLSHRNLTWTCDTVRGLLQIGPHDRLLSYLPMSHVSEQLFTVHGPVCTGSRVYYAESIRAAPVNLREVQPTVLFGVPRIWEKLAGGLSARLGAVGGARAKVVEWARATATRMVRTRSEGKEPSLELVAQYELAETLVLTKLKRALGLEHVRVCLTGAAPIDEQTIGFFASIGIQLLEVYGQSESAGPITLNQPRRARPGSVGPKLPGLTLKLAEDGEILVTGPNVFVGYHRDEVGTQQVLRNGMLRTGDIGRVDPEGFLTITGRKREILVTAGGKNIAPKGIEAALRRDPLIRDAVVIGDRRRYLTALLTIDDAVATQIGAHNPVHESELVRERIAHHVERVNADLASAEQLKAHTLLPRALEIETGELTPTLKLRRRRIEELWKREIDAMYSGVDVRTQTRARLSR